MKLDIISKSPSLIEAVDAASTYFKSAVWTDREKLSVYETYRLYSAEHRFIPMLWAYRIVCNKGEYTFGRVQ
jgi:hypothetical protein